MSYQLMTSVQQSAQHANGPSGALWQLHPGQAIRLSIGPGIRQLHLIEGRLWLTTDGTQQSPSEDIWLCAGDTIQLASGSNWVMEASASARFQLLVPPQSCPHLRWSAWTRRQIRSWQQRVSRAWRSGPVHSPA